jgi:hypothetical protein
MPTITPTTLTGSTADASVDATTLLFRRMADRGDGKGGAADGIVSDAEAKTFVTEVENLGLFHIKTTKNNSLDTHEQIGALEFEMRRLEGLGQTQTPTYQTLSAHVSSLMQGLVQYDSATIEGAYKAKAGAATLPAGKLVGQYENIYFVSKNAATAADAQTYVKNFIAETSKTRTGRYILELMIKQDNGKPVVISLDDNPLGDNRTTSHNAITVSYKMQNEVVDAYTALIHEISHAVGHYWQGDITVAQNFCSLYPVDSNRNGTSDAAEFESVINKKRLATFNPLVLVKDKKQTLYTFDAYAKKNLTPDDLSYTEHVATFFEQSFAIDRGVPVGREIYDRIIEDPRTKNLHGMPGPDEH